MRIDGLWLPDETGAYCPVVPAAISVAGSDYPVQFLVDTGATQTVLGAGFAPLLQAHQQTPAELSLLSAGGVVPHFYAAVALNFTDTVGRRVRFNIIGAVLTDPTQANTHLLGRDILDHFAVLCDREADVVALLRPPHTYTISG